MRNYSRITPEGTRDILFKECKIQRELEAKLSQLFLSHGYNEVMTPGVEYFDLFCQPGAAIPQQEMYKTTDNNGRLVVFRPDSTLPIARMAAARLQRAKKPVRLFYNQSVYRNRPDLTGRNNEISQMGVELLGAAGLKADIELIALAVETISSTCQDFRVEIGHAGLFKAFASRLPVDKDQREEIRRNIEAKNYAALDDRLRNIERTDAVDALEQLPRLFGGFEALEQAGEICRDEETSQMLSYLKQLYTSLSKMGHGSRMLVDLGIVQRNDYYTGMVFRIYTGELGNSVLVGGRYDGLLEKFGDAMPSIGFSVDTESLTKMLLYANADQEQRQLRSILHYEPGYEIEAQKFIEQRIAQGEICINSIFDSKEECEDYARAIGIDRIYYMDNTYTDV